MQLPGLDARRDAGADAGGHRLEHWHLGADEDRRAGDGDARAFNYREGFRPADDRLPDRFYEPHTCGDADNKLPGIDRAAAAQSLQTLYHLRGYDPATGAPTLATLEDLDIAWVADAIGLPATASAAD